MPELLVIRKKDRNLTARVINRKKEEWTPECFGSSGKDTNFEAVVKNRDPSLIAYLLFDLKNLGFPIDKAIARYKELVDKPDLFFLR